MLQIKADDLSRHMECNGARLMPASFPAVDDPVARDEGDAAHYMAQQVLYGVDINSLINTKAPNGFIMTADMAEYVMIYINDVVNPLDPSRIGDIEVDTSWGNKDFQISASPDYPNFQINGRSDRIYYCPEQAALYIHDFKYGWGLREPFMNWTLISHAIGYLKNHRELMPNIRTITFVINQPRPHHPDGKNRSWTITAEELAPLYDQIVAAMTNPNDTLRSGYEWCRHCQALATCPAARAARMNAIDACSPVFTDAMNNDALSYELDVVRNAKSFLEAQLSALEELTIHRLTGGEVIPNYGFENQYAHTRFKAGFTGPILTAMTGIDCNKPGLITPAEFKRRGGSEETYKAVTERPMTGRKLIRATADQRAQRLLKR